MNRNDGNFMEQNKKNMLNISRFQITFLLAVTNAFKYLSWLNKKLPLPSLSLSFIHSLNSPINTTLRRYRKIQKTNSLTLLK